MKIKSRNENVKMRPQKPQESSQTTKNEWHWKPNA